MKKRYNNSLVKHILAIPLLLLLAANSFSQQTFKDSLLAQYNKCTVDTTKMDIIINAGDYLSNSNPDLAINYGKDALKLAEKIHDNKRQIFLFNLIGEGYDQKGDITNAITFYDEGTKIAKQINDIHSLAAAQLNIGSCYTDVGNYKLSINCYKTALEHYTKLKDVKGMCKTEVYLSDAFFKEKKPDTALYYLDKAKTLSLQINGYLLHYIYNNIAESYCLKKEFKKAEENEVKGMAISEKLNDLYNLSAGYLVLTKIYLSRNDNAKAQINVEKGLKIAKQTQIRENLIDAYRLSSLVFEKQRKYEEALKYKSLYVITKDSLESTLNDYILQDYENRKKDGEVAVMKTEEIRKDAELKRQHFINAVGFTAFLLLLCIAIYIYYSRNSLRKAHLEIEKAYQEVNSKQTEIVQQNEALTRSNEQISLQSEDIKKLNNLKDRLFSIISHDLRSPLRNLQTVLNLLLEGNLSHDKFNTIVAKLVSGLSVTSDLVENLLHWSKSQLTGATVVGASVDVNTLAQNQLHLFEKQAADKQLELINNISKNTIVYADKYMIDLALRNLVANAIKFSHPKGHIAISAKQFENHTEVSVTDEGIGITPENVHKVFQEDERFTTRGTNNEAGTGLGLLLCKDFIEKNNGTIGVESKVNEGSRFWFRLPNGNDGGVTID